jgi:hypothetical protein
LELYPLIYSMRDNFIAQQSKVLDYRHQTAGQMSAWLIWILALLLLISAGVSYRALESLTFKTVINLPMPLNTFPVLIGNWTGIDLSIPSITQEYMKKNFADDYISRRYVNGKTQAWVDVYVVYCASRPGGMLGHQPQVCYPGNGWIHDSTEKSQFLTRQGMEIPCLIHRFHKPAPSYDESVILNFFIVNGQLDTNQEGFSGLWGRRFNLTRNPARYVAQVQISSKSENSIRNAAKDMAELIIDLLPDKNGKDRATEKTQTPSDFRE